MTETGYSCKDLNRKKFSTLDRDNDNYGNFHCAIHHEGGWWFNCCHYAFLNGLYNTSNWWGPWYPTVPRGTMLKKTSMMVRRR